MKASDIPDEEFLFAVSHIQENGEVYWATPPDIEGVLVGYPYKIMRAKAAKLIKRKLMTGCGNARCTCRGEWELAKEGQRIAGTLIA
jgi:hypothetical protein